MNEKLEEKPKKKRIYKKKEKFNYLEEIGESGVTWEEYLGKDYDYEKIETKQKETVTKLFNGIKKELKRKGLGYKILINPEFLKEEGFIPGSKVYIYSLQRSPHMIYKDLKEMVGKVGLARKYVEISPSSRRVRYNKGV